MRLARSLLSLAVLAAFLFAIPARHFPVTPRYEQPTLVAPFRPPMERWCMLPFPLLARSGSTRQQDVATAHDLKPAWGSFSAVTLLCYMIVFDRDGSTANRLELALEWVNPITVLSAMLVFLILWQGESQGDVPGGTV